MNITEFQRDRWTCNLRENKVEKNGRVANLTTLPEKIRPSLAPVAKSPAMAVLFTKLAATDSPVFEHTHPGTCRFQGFRRDFGVLLFLILGHFYFLLPEMRVLQSLDTLPPQPGVQRSHDAKTPAGRLTFDTSVQVRLLRALRR